MFYGRGTLAKRRNASNESVATDLRLRMQSHGARLFMKSPGVVRRLRNPIHDQPQASRHLAAAMAGRAVLAGHSVLSGFVARTGSHFAASQMLWCCNAVEQHVGADEAWLDGASLLNVVFCRR